MKLCDYGCGQEAKYYFKQAKKWCCSKRHISCIAVRRISSISHCGNSSYWKGKKLGPRSKEVKDKISKTMQGIEPWNKGLNKETNVSLKELSKKTTRNWKNSSSFYHTKEFKLTHLKSTNTNEFKEKKRKDTEKLWKDLEFQRKQQEARNLKPNKPEIKILDLLNRLYPNEWKYTGDYSFWINGSNPDFTYINGKKLLIEHFGTYWHKDDNPENRIKIFSDFGYKTLIIWEEELKNVNKVEEKIKEFTKGRNKC